MSVEINIKSLSGSTCVIKVNPNDTISDMKQKLKKRIENGDIPQKFIFGYQELRDNDKLSDFNINSSQSLMFTVILKDKTSMLFIIYIYICIYLLYMHYIHD